MKSHKLKLLWQAHYQILKIIFLKEFIKINVSTNTMIKNVKLTELNKKIATVFLNTQTLETEFFNRKEMFSCNKNYKKVLWKPKETIF